MIGLFLHFCFRLRQSGFHKRNRKKLETSDSSDSDSIALMTPLMTPIFYFHQVVSALTTLTANPVKMAILSCLLYVFRLKSSSMANVLLYFRFTITSLLFFHLRKLLFCDSVSSR